MLGSKTAMAVSIAMPITVRMLPPRLRKSKLGVGAADAGSFYQTATSTIF